MAYITTKQVLKKMDELIEKVKAHDWYDDRLFIASQELITIGETKYVIHSCDPKWRQLELHYVKPSMDLEHADNKYGITSLAYLRPNRLGKVLTAKVIANIINSMDGT